MSTTNAIATNLDATTASLIASAQYEDGIRAALKIGDEWGFTALEKVAMLGLMPHVAEHPDGIASFCISASSRDIQSRCNMIIAIHYRLRAHYGVRVASVLNQPRLGAMDRRSPKQLIVSGEYWSLYFLWMCGNTVMRA